MKKPEKTVWTEDMIERLKELQAQTDPPLSFSAIAAAMSAEFKATISTNAAIGKAHRLMVPKRPHAIRDRKPKEPEKPKIAPNGYVPEWKPPPVPARTDGLLELIQLRSGLCHYPYGDHAPYLFCGKPTVRLQAYCPEHCNTCFNVPVWKRLALKV